MISWNFRRRAQQVRWLPLAAILFGVPLVGQELTRPLTAEDVACNERQLERLLQRMNSAHEFYILPQLPNILMVAPGGNGSSFAGLVATAEGFRVDVGGGPPTDYFEHYLAYNLVTKRQALFLNPQRAILPQVTLTREKSGTNLVSPGGYFDLTLTLDPGPGGSGVLAINNFIEPPQGDPYNGFLATSTKPGRGLKEEGLLVPCHAKLTEFDLHVFSILQRVVRTAAMSEFFEPDMEAAIFRGEDPHTYRINFYPIYEEFEARGRMSTEVRIDWTAAGKLTTGEIRALPTCANSADSGCSNLQRSSLLIYLISPVFGGREYSDDATTQEGGYYIWYQGPSEPHPLNFAALLSKSAWNEPAW